MKDLSQRLDAQTEKPKIIPPTNGRIVWFTPGEHFPGVWDSPRQSLAATVCHVWGNNLVNLSVIDSWGRQHPQESVRLIQPGEDADALVAPGKPYAEWMPFQIGQAAKA